MSKTPSSHHPLRASCAAFVLGAAVACGAAVDPIQGSETHFLARCSADCGSELECIDGVCTRACQTDSECTSLSSVAACVSRASGDSSCRVACGVDDECRSQNDGWSCASASCVGTPALLSSSGPSAGGRCPTFAGGVQQPSETPTTIEAVPDASNVELAYADDSGVYWIDFDGGIRRWRQGDTSATTLRPAPSAPGTRLGLTGDVTRLYWTEGEAYPPGPNEPGPPPPPVRVMTIAKDGGAAQVIVGSESQVLIPLGVDAGGRLFVTNYGSELSELAPDGTLSRVANVPALADDLQMVDDQVYWSESGADTEPNVVFAATPGRGDAVRVTTVEGGTYGSFVAGRGVVLWTPEETRFDPLLLVQHFRMLNENTGCVQDLPSVELSVGQTLIDDHHVYWHSFNALGSVSPDEPEPSVDLLRVDLRTGRFEQVTTPGMESVSGGDLLAQSGDTLYVRVNPGSNLYAVRKPD